MSSVMCVIVVLATTPMVAPFTAPVYSADASTPPDVANGHSHSLVQSNLDWASHGGRQYLPAACCISGGLASAPVLRFCRSGRVILLRKQPRHLMFWPHRDQRRKQNECAFGSAWRRNH